MLESLSLSPIASRPVRFTHRSLFHCTSHSVMVTLPAWAIEQFHAGSEPYARSYRTDEEMMSLAVRLSDRNVAEGTGGPFGAAVFERHTDGACTLVSVGTNRVVPLGNCALHGEMVAIMLAQKRAGSFTLNLDAEGSDGGEGLFYDDSKEEGEGGGGTDATGGSTTKAAVCEAAEPVRRKRRFELFTSCEPCAMCLGATLWSGASRIVCGATKDDAQAVGFDEGPVFEESYRHLERSGVEVTRGVLREEAAGVLRRYGASAGIVYNR
ncbi:hypothetical protein ACHAWF_009595 [Thalassiosira exigua]